MSANKIELVRELVVAAENLIELSDRLREGIVVHSDAYVLELIGKIATYKARHSELMGIISVLRGNENESK